MTKKVNTVLIASGSGTDADSIMKKYASGCIPNINIAGLFSTKLEAGCLKKAEDLGIPTEVIDRKKYSSEYDFNEAVRFYLFKIRAELVFLVGCIVKIYPIAGISVYNIHPADPYKHGGNKMYGLEVHRRVILEIVDQIKRGKADIREDTFYTWPTIHEIDMKYDSDHTLLKARVEVPEEIIIGLLDGVVSKGRADEAASQLQQVVLPYEWMMLPAAVEMAAKKIIDAR